MALSLERIKELVALHAPVLHMHPADRFMPCSVEWFMQRSELWLDLPVGPEVQGILSNPGGRRYPSSSCLCCGGMHRVILPRAMAGPACMVYLMA